MIENYPGKRWFIKCLINGDEKEISIEDLAKVLAEADMNHIEDEIEVTVKHPQFDDHKVDLQQLNKIINKIVGDISG